jgi:hypothetical protein
MYKAWKLIYGPEGSKSYYPKIEKKNRVRMLFDNFLWILRKREVNHFYFAYGLDCKHANPDEYLGVKECWDYFRKAVNSNAIDGVNMNYHCLLRDKLVFSMYVSGLGFPTPKTLAFGDKNGLVWVGTSEKVGFGSLLEKDGMDAFYKPLLGLGGKGIFPLKSINNKLFIENMEYSLAKFKDMIISNFIIQERIHQHESLLKLHPYSVNSIRAITALYDGNPILLFSIFRVGNNGCSVDNWSNGGIMIGIDSKTGKLNKYGYLKPGSGRRVIKHPETNIVFENYQIPYFKQMKHLVITLHRYFYGIHSIAWDVAITETGPIVIEGNDEWGLAMPQILYGGIKSKYLSVYPKNLIKNQYIKIHEN